MAARKIYLGFDGGGTKTECIAVDAAGKIAGRSVAGPSNPLRTSYESALAALEAAGSQAMHNAEMSRDDVAGVCAGLAGAAGPAISARLTASLTQLWPNASIHVITDAESALSAAAATEPAVILIAGTGSIALGRNSVGKAARAGGYGPWIGDAGSAYDIGRRGAEAAARALDGSGPQTTLAQEVIQALESTSWTDAVEKIAAAPESALPQLFAVVVAAAGTGDPVARNIISQAALDLAKLALTVVGRLGLKDETFILARTGGVFGRSALLDRRVDRLLARVCPSAQIGPLAVPPALAAARLAIHLAGAAK